MNRVAGLILAVFLWQTPVSFAEEADSPKEEAQNSSMVLETDKESAAESLNRITGQYDRGFSPPEATYQSESLKRTSPFHSRDEDRTSGY